MKLNNENSRTIGELVTKVNVAEQAIIDLLASDFKFEIIPATLGTSIVVANEGMSRTVHCTVVNTAGDIARYINGEIAVAVATSSSAGEVSICGLTNLTFVEGQASVELIYSGVFEVADTVTLTVGTAYKIASVTLDAVTSVDTLVE